MIPISSPEILAPAGEWTALEAAINAGCDAVYVGVDALNMRASARNFPREALADVVARCRRSQVRCYLALNTIVYEAELPLLDALIETARSADVDAVIASDFAVIEAARRAGLEVHVSTQMSVSNARGLAVLHRHFSVRRFVLARECSLADMARIRDNLVYLLGEAASRIELEAFAHGAMCVSVSGRCFLSQFQYGKSANRGECLQPCRREYRVTNVEEEQAFDLGTHYVMSPKDLCTLSFLEQMLDAGVVSLKIEGRNRSPEYVAVVTRAYREVADAIVQQRNAGGDPVAIETLKQAHLVRIERVYHRGYSAGFCFGHPVEAWTKSGGSQASTRKAYVGRVTNYYAKPGVAEVLVQDHGVAKGDTVMFHGATTGVVEQFVHSMEVDHEPVCDIAKGMSVAIKTDAPVRRNDKLYVVLPNTSI